MALKQKTAKIVFEICSKYTNEKILDLGCGERLYENYIGKNKYIGIDVENSGNITKKPDFFYDGKIIPFESNSFKVVLFLEVLEHVEKYENLILEIHRILKKDGILILTMPFIWPEHEQPFDFRRFTRFELRNLFKKNDFQILQEEQIDFGLFGISRIMLSQSKKLKGPLNKLIYKSLGLILKILSKIEKIEKKSENLYLTNLFVVKK